MPVISPLPAIKALPKAVSALVLHPAHDVVLAAADDRSLRTFNLRDGRPVGAIVGLPEEVAAMVVDLSSLDETDAGCSDGGWGSVWIACGSDVHQLRLSPTPFLRTFQAALVRTFDLGKVELNDLSLSPDGKQLAWCGDDGRLGVLDIKTGSKTWMKGKHANIAGSLSFLPNHPSTLFSTGYDTFARTWSTSTGSTIDTLAIEPPAGSATSMAPTFPISLHAAPFAATESVVAIGTADGALWLSIPDLAPKTSKGKKKKAGGAWRQLDRLARFEVEGEGAGNFAVGVALIPCRSSPSTNLGGSTDPTLDDFPRVLALSHTGALVLCRLHSTAKGFALKQLASWHTASVAKCNALGVSAARDAGGKVTVVVGGFGARGEGVVESWLLDDA